MRFWLCLALAACGIDSRPAPSRVPPPPPPTTAPRPAPATLAAPPITAAHGAEIVALGVTTDGTAAASADRLGGLRLWPALDGTREPIVIQGTAARAVALAREGDGFALGTLDDAGGLHIMRISAAGAVRERITVAREPRAVEIHSTPAGLLILRADQTLALVDSGGRVVSRLTPDAGSHVDSILVRGNRALALVQEGKRGHGQWIQLEHGMAWGDATPTFTIKVAQAVLSPDGDLLAVTRPRSLHPALIDVATGAARKTPLCVAKSWPEDDSARAASEILRADNAPVPLAFFSGSLVACSVTGMLQWWNTNGSPESSPAGTLAVSATTAGVSSRALIFAIGPNLALVTPTANRFLGYGLHDLARLRSGPTGVLISGGQQALLLDAGLRERSRFEPGASAIEWREALLIDERYAITATPRRPRDDGFQLTVLDGVARAEHQLLPYTLRDRDLAYEPTTGLLATADATGAMLFQLDPTTHTFGKPIRIASWMPPYKVSVLDPGQSGGIAALQLDNANDAVLAGEFPLADVQPGATIAPRKTYRVPGELRAVDRAGRLYMQGAGNEVVVYARGAPVARLPGLPGMTLRPSPDGSHIAAFQPPRLVMLDATGQVRWEAAHSNSTDVVWTASGELIAQFVSGIAKVDLRTGALVERRCGWSFGLSEAPLEVGQSGPSICEVAR